MNARLCIRLGLVAGGSVGVLVGLLHGIVCCTPPHPPTWNQLALDGLIVALLAMFLSSIFVCVVTRRPFWTVFSLALLIGIFVGVLLGPPAYHIHPPWLALLICALLGALIGWIVCRILCFRRYKIGVAR